MKKSSERSVAIVGGGPAALMLAAILDEKKYDVTIYERNPAAGRKFLVAGDGGFNLSHSEPIEQFITRYTPSGFLEESLRNFSNEDLRVWLKTIGIDTFIGTSKRIFPVEGIKPIDVLNAFLMFLKNKNVKIKTRHTWKGWNEKNELSFEAAGETISVKPEITVFALGGNSWKVTGSDGTWTGFFSEKGITIIPFQPSNCACEVKWDASFLSKAEGKSLKNISIRCGEKEKKGEVVITRFGIEGGAIYALSPQIRKELNENKKAKIYIDLKPEFSVEEIKKRLSAKGNRSYTKQLEDELNLNEVHIALLKSILSKEEFISTALLSEKIKALPLIITATASMDEAISTVGGICLTELDESFQLKKLPKNYCIGEMLDYDAPTGGYLLQSCFSMGKMLADKLNSL